MERFGFAMITSERARQISSSLKLESLEDFETLISRIIEEHAAYGTELRIYVYDDKHPNVYDYIKDNNEVLSLLRNNGFSVYIDDDIYTDYNNHHVRISW